MKHYLYIVTAAVIFGSSGAFIKTVALPVSSITFYRMVVPFLLVTGLLLLKKQPFPAINDRFMMTASILNAARMFLFFAGYTLGDISTTVILLYTWPVFTAIWSILFLGDTLTPRKFFLFTSTIAGVALININKTLSLSDAGFTGMACIIGSAFLYSFTVVIFKKKSETHSPWQTVWFQNLFGTVAFLPFILINRPVPELWQSGIASIYAVLIGVAGFGLFFLGLKHIDASRASFLTYIEVISGLFFGVIIFNETLTWNLLTGGVLIILSAIALSRSKD